MSKRKKVALKKIDSKKIYQIGLNRQEITIIKKIINLGEKYGKHNIYLKNTISSPNVIVILHYKGKVDYTILPDFTVNPKNFLTLRNKGFIQSYDNEHRRSHLSVGQMWRLRTELFDPSLN